MMMSPAVVRGVDHIGITVPDIDGATRYFVDAFGAMPLYDVLSMDDEPLGGPDIEAAIEVAEGTLVRAIRLLKFPDGPSLEIFHYQAANQQTPAIPSDFGLQHLALYVDDLLAAAERIKNAGGRLLRGPMDLPALESGTGNKFWYTKTPWGMTIELITYPSPQPYEQASKSKRWKPTPIRDI